MQDVLMSGALAESGLTFCLEPGLVCHYIPIIRVPSVKVEAGCSDGRCHAVMRRTYAGADAVSDQDPDPCAVSSHRFVPNNHRGWLLSAALLTRFDPYQPLQECQ